MDIVGKRQIKFKAGGFARLSLALINILIEGNRILVGARSTEFTLAENPTVDDRLSNEVLKSSGSLKQEVKSIENHRFS